MTTLLVRAAMLLLPLPALLLAQPGRADDEKAVDRIERLKKVRIIEMLELNEDQTVRFFARFNAREGSHRDLMKQRTEALDKIERLVRNKADAKEYEPLFGEVRAVDEKMVHEKQQFFDGLTDILSTEQRAKLILFERHFEQELREAMKEMHHRRYDRDRP
jgi:hypothetical protein